MRLVFEGRAFEDLQYWTKHDRKLLLKILNLIEQTQRAPFEGIGKPEPLKHQLARYWSRRINQEHRLVYRVDGDELVVISCRYHYKD